MDFAPITFIMISLLQNFLLLDEICESSIKLSNLNNLENRIERYNKKLNISCSGVKIELEEVSASWRINHPLQILHSITLKIKSGELCAILGPPGSGKSSLINLLLQELSVDAGTVRLFQIKNGFPVDLITKSGFVQSNPKITISYASQDPLLFSGTVRDNILFGLDYDQARYQEVTKVCSLVNDFEQLPNRDMTIVEEGGKSLSICQKTKVNLARAIYKQADLYLLDDIFNGIKKDDTQFIFKECVLEFLRGKTRILITDHLDHLKQVDTIAIIEKGSIKNQGTYSTLKKKSSELNEMFNIIQNNKTNKYTQIITKNINESKNNMKSNLMKSQYSSRFSCRQEVVKLQVDDKVNDRTITNTNNLKEINDRYFSSWREISIFLLLLILIILWQLATISVDQWMAYWTTVESTRTCVQAPKYTCLNLQYLLKFEFDFNVMKILQNEHKLIVHQYAKYIYILLMVILIGLFISSVYFLINFFISRGRKLYHFIFDNFLKAKMEFFNSQFSEKTSNTLLKDIEVMDNSIIPAVIQVITIIIQIIVTVINIGIVFPWTMILFIFLGPILYHLTKYFCRTIRSLQELENITKNPLDLHIRETLHGLTIIRSYSDNILLKFCRKFNQYQESNVGARYVLIFMISAYALAIELFFCVFISCTYFLLIIMHQENTFNEFVGFTISQSLILMSLLQYAVQQIAVILSQLIAMRRIIQFIDIPKEGPIEMSNPTPVNWPSNGQIIWKNVFINDNISGSSVLKNSGLTIELCWKVGVVEKTGADESSIISALFRLTDKNIHGEIIIDGLDIKSVGLQDLRSNISIIPKDPFLFTGTLRFNLDPYQKYTDKAMWDVLGEVELNGITLDQWITDGGKSFSVNERKLICLARELLRSNRILILDRITDDLDLNTKIIIQRVLQSYFKYCTIITITDHLESIISGDLILVMENGCLLEFGSPYELLVTRVNSTFGQMIKKYNETMFESIIQDVIKNHVPHRRYNSRRK